MLPDLSVWLKMILISGRGIEKRCRFGEHHTLRLNSIFFALLIMCVELPSFPSTSGHQSVFQKLVWVTEKKNWHCCYFPSRCPATLTPNFLFMKYCFCTAGFEAWRYSHMHCWLYLLHPHFYHQNLVPYYCASSFIYSMNRLCKHVLLEGATTLHQTTVYTVYLHKSSLPQANYIVFTYRMKRQSSVCTHPYVLYVSLIKAAIKQ